jgi:hypothetical protein
VTEHQHVDYRGRRYLVLWIEGRAHISVEVQRWAGLGMVITSRTTKRGPTFSAVLALGNEARRQKALAA